MLLRVPPKHSIAFVIGFLKGKSAVRLHRAAGNRRVTGLLFLSRRYCVSTVGLDEATVRQYIRVQEKVEKQQLNLFKQIKRRAPAGLSSCSCPLLGGA